MNLYAATTNAGKLRDFAYAATAAVTIEPLPGLRAISAPPEGEPTFAGNARAKAVYYSRHAPDEMVLADDSGLAVDALDGAPGVRSARYAEDLNFTAGDTTDERNNACLLNAMVNHDLRRAAYHCALAVARNGIVLAEAEGTLTGEILSEPRGTGGFGYDPLFLLPELQLTMAEVDPDRRLEYSHRGRALRTLLQHWTPRA